MERSTIFHGKTRYKWPFSIAMLVYQRVIGFSQELCLLRRDVIEKGCYQLIEKGCDWDCEVMIIYMGWCWFSLSNWKTNGKLWWFKTLTWRIQQLLRSYRLAPTHYRQLIATMGLIWWNYLCTQFTPPCTRGLEQPWQFLKRFAQLG